MASSFVCPPTSCCLPDILQQLVQLFSFILFDFLFSVVIISRATPITRGSADDDWLYLACSLHHVHMHACAHARNWAAPCAHKHTGGWTEEEYVECMRAHGRDFRQISRHLNMRTESTAKHYFYKHRQRLGLDQVCERVCLHMCVLCVC